jgi:cobalt-precorrin 5A hydrolase
MIVAGIGCRAGVSAAEVDVAIEAALSRSAPGGSALNLIATPAAKGRESGIIAVAAARGIPLVLIEQSALEAASPRTLTRSVRALATMNVRSVAEAAALAGAGLTAKLLGPRVAVGPVTCALAVLESPRASDGSTP